MLLFNFIFWVLGIVLIAVGVIILHVNETYPTFLHRKFIDIIFMLLLVGLLMFITSFIGGKGAVRYNYCLIKASAIIAVIVFILCVFIGALGFAYKNNIDDVVGNTLKRAVPKYNISKTETFLLDSIQDKLKCCGNTGPMDFGNASCGVDSGVPSCHVNKTCNGTLYATGCKQPIIRLIRKNYVFVGMLASVVVVTQLVGIILSCCLLKSLHQRYQAI